MTHPENMCLMGSSAFTKVDTFLRVGIAKERLGHSISLKKVSSYPHAREPFIFLR